MNFLSILFVFALNVDCEVDSITVNQASFLENNYWGEDLKQIKTDEGYLYDVSIGSENETKVFYGECCTQNLCYYDKDSKLYYAVLPAGMTEYINSLDKKKGYLNFAYIFTQDVINSSSEFQQNQGKERYLKNYKSLSSPTGDSIPLENNGIDLCVLNMKDIFRVFIDSRLLILKKDINSTNKEKSSDADFKLYHFDSYSVCSESFKNFLDSLNYLKLEGESEVATKEELRKINVNDSTTLQVSYFLHYLEKKFNDDFDTPDKKDDYDVKLRFFKKCHDHLKQLLMSEEIFLLIEDNYNVDFYLSELYFLIKNAIDEIYSVGPIDRPIDDRLDLCYDVFVRNVEKLQEVIFSKICEPKYIQKYFTDVLGKKAENLNDYVAVEKILCDFYNMLVYIANSESEVTVDCHQSNYVQPSFIDDYKCKIVKGISVHFHHPLKFSELNAFDSDGQEVNLEENVDYFLNKLGDVFFISEKIRKRNIHEILICSDNKKINKRFNVEEYLK